MTSNETVGICEYCGTRQTLPRLSSDWKANLYDRASQFRRNNEFDRAIGIYEQILAADETDAESYWSLVLCRYGIEYVEDPVTHKRIPTVNRTQTASVFADKDYLAALQYADATQRAVYEAEAGEIQALQSRILEISRKEEPFDVFICYKETDQFGRRTSDSVIAAELYHQLQKEGFQVFFSRITLEEKLGMEYEPYIFAALHSARVMVVLGTRPEHFNAPWVKNEWSRYLALIRQGEKKLLIPAYRDMNPYELPEELSYLQAQDMSRLGFMQDLIHGIKKMLPAQGESSGQNGSEEALLKRAFLFLEDKNWKSADAYCEKVLDRNPENGTAYLYQLMAKLQVSRPEELQQFGASLNNHGTYRLAVRYGTEAWRAKLVDYAAGPGKKRGKPWKKPAFFGAAVVVMVIAAAAVGLISGRIQKNSVYEQAETLFFAGAYEEAIKALETLGDYKDSLEIVASCKTGILEEQYAAAVLQKNAGAYREAIAAFSQLDGYRDSVEQIAACESKIRDDQYDAALRQMEAGDYAQAAAAFEALNDHRDSAEKSEECRALLEAEQTPEPQETIEVGDEILFGTYEQDNDLDNGKEPIQWLVLKKTDDRVLVVSKYGLDCQPYNTREYDVTWKNCSLRTWLNGTFFQAAFSEEEQERIPMVTVNADRNPSYRSNSGESTKDKVFLLSITEVYQYFDSDSDRQCKRTDYAFARGVTRYDEGYTWWWLRTPGMYQNNASGVFPTGAVSESGDYVDYTHDAVRPAMWITLDG